MKLYLMESANFDIDRSILSVGVGIGQIVRITNTFALLEHPKGNVLIDTGFSREVITNVEEAWGTSETRLAVPIVRPEMELSVQLAAVKLKPEDIRYVVLTHLHQDHAGANLEVPDATFICQRNEMEYAKNPDIPSMRREYKMEELAPDRLRYELSDGEHDLFGDGSVTMFPTPGHTPGSQAVIVRLPDTGPVMLVGDAIWTSDLLDEMMLPGICWFAAEYCRSRAKIKRIAEEIGAKIIHPHEPDQFKIWRKSPQFHT
jgi:glyoxylase-like metal-dependent hydrolase (beta-lactamase superfamily II)